jgi:BMFP domain-containing protein YqiC
MKAQCACVVQAFAGRGVDAGDEAGIINTGADLQKNLRATLSAGLSKLDVVTRQEFEIQREMLDVLRKQIDELTAQVEALEKAKRT